jgi:hypothetical protein
VVVRRIELYQSEEGDSFTHMKRLQSGFKKITSQLLELDKHVVIERLYKQLTDGASDIIIIATSSSSDQCSP